MKRFLPILVGAAALLGTAAHAAPSGSSASTAGTARAAVVQPVSMVNTAAMRFGQIAQPSTSGTVTLSPTGTVTGSGGAAGNQAIAQTGGGPAPGIFMITTYPNAAFSVFGPASFALSNGGQTMNVTLLTGTLQQVSSTATSMTYRLNVGGTLNMAANQAVGTYNGSYSLITVYQ